ncbi:hypothetical protein Tco_1085689 [Tanacetum coccineum]
MRISVATPNKAFPSQEGKNIASFGFKKEEVIRGCVGKGENKEDKVDKEHVFWAPAPLIVKSWVDVDDEDYYAITAPPLVWGVGAGKDDKVAPLELIFDDNID